MIQLQDIQVGRDAPLCVIAGPCVAESRELCLDLGERVRDRCRALGLGYIFKASYDKANRTSIHSDRGPGLYEGLALIAGVARELGVPCTTDIHLPEQAKVAADAGIDLLQIPAFLCRQTDLLVAAASTGRAVNVKKGQFLGPAEVPNIFTKLDEACPAGRCQSMVTDRGTFFGYGRLVNDFVALGDLLEMGRPVCFDATHSTQQPGGQGTTSGGRPERAPLLAKAAVAAGVHCVFLETHPDPGRATSDAATMLPLDVTLDLLPPLARLAEVSR